MTVHHRSGNQFSDLAMIVSLKIRLTVYLSSNTDTRMCYACLSAYLNILALLKTPILVINFTIPSLICILRTYKTCDVSDIYV